MPQSSKPLVGSVFERKVGSVTTPQIAAASKTGFPAVQHRSLSTFARGRLDVRNKERSRDVPTVLPTEPSPSQSIDPDGWRDQMSRENEQNVAAMTEEEREQAKEEIFHKFGAGVGDLLKRVREGQVGTGARGQASNESGERGMVLLFTTQDQEVGLITTTKCHLIIGDRCLVKTPPPALSTSSTRPSSRADRKIRFAEPGPKDVYVYESAPPSPRRKVLALPPPSGDPSAISLGSWKGKMADVQVPESHAQPQPEEGTPEYIRRRFFPDAPANDPNIAWMEHSAPPTSPNADSSSLRFDLKGVPIPDSLSSTLPTHLGLHHHAEGSLAGYTLDDIFLLSRSTVPAQRATMLSVLARIARNLAKLKAGQIDGMLELKGKEESLRVRVVAAGAEAIFERGGVGLHAIEVLWECIVGWDESLIEVHGIELQTPSDIALNTLPLDYLLPQIATLFIQGDPAPESMARLLDIVHRLAQHSNEYASRIISTPHLIANIVQVFLFTGVAPPDTVMVPNPAALILLTTLATSSRENARALEEFADMVLQFITTLPPSSSYPLPLATTLLARSLRFYTVLAKYGIYSHIAATAMSHLIQLAQYICSDACGSPILVAAWAGLVEAWTICAIDPHQTTPSHGILWSQISGWRWDQDLLELLERFGSGDEDRIVWQAVWRAEAAWLEGARINGVRAGQTERFECIEMVKSEFDSGKAKDIMRSTVVALEQGLSQLGPPWLENHQSEPLRSLSHHANVLTAGIRLWVACLPPAGDGPLPSPPFPLPFSRISNLCAKLVTHPLWSFISDPEFPPFAYPYCLSLSNLLGYYLQLSRRLPDIPEDLWVGQALSIMTKLLPGEEEFVQATVHDIIHILNMTWASSRNIPIPPEVWGKGLALLEPFFHCPLTLSDIHVGPDCATPQSIKSTTTQRLPSISTVRSLGLPFRRDWPLSPIDHLLRSASSVVFKNLPQSWDGSELEVTRASLALTKISTDVLWRYSLRDPILSREEMIFACMKVFMLEHGQPQNDSSHEVFRDHAVGQLMESLLRPFTIAGIVSQPANTPVIPPQINDDLEKIAVHFLGASTPFYQYYTDFIALYDAISFSHPLFGQLVLPPTAMRYPLDYRKLLWNDYSHILKTIRTPCDQILSGDLREFLFPIENDAHMLGAYLRSLVKGDLQGFLHFVAVHHTACNIWLDIGDETVWNEDRANKLLNSLADQGDNEVVRQVVRYCQPKTGPIKLPPHCFEYTSESSTLRLGYIHRWGGDSLTQRLQKIFSE
ncbi:hypothetical protein BD779DRAFT_1434294 [Infundibulicybe gibba]|nr:hypothetical protein BD779DRAFT_1434294 [Infundibulicybe gibba]